MTVADELEILQGNHVKPVPTSGRPTRIWAGDVTTVNPDGTIDVRPIMSRAGKVGVIVPESYTPTVGDRVLVTNLNGDPQWPTMLTLLTTASTPPAVTGSLESGAALESLLTVLADAGLITNNTTA